MVHAGFAEVNGAGIIEYVSGDFNSLVFNFDITLAGGQFQCLDIHPTTSLTSNVESYLDVCYFNTNAKNRWVADLELLFQKDNVYASSYYFGGNDVGANYGIVQIATWDITKYHQYTTDEVTFNGPTLNIPAGYSQVCIFCACGRYSYCPDSQRFKGSFRLRGYATGSTPTPAKVLPGCTLPFFDGINPTLSPAYTPPPSTAIPTNTPQPTKETKSPTDKPTRRPTTIGECIAECTSTDAPTYSPAWIPPSHYPTSLKNFTSVPTFA